MRLKQPCASTLQVFRLANLLNELLHECQRVGKIEAELCAAIELKINIDLVVVVLVDEIDVVNVCKRNCVLTEVEYCHNGLLIAELVKQSTVPIYRAPYVTNPDFCQVLELDRSKESVASIAQAWHDVSLVIQLAVQGRAHKQNVGMIFCDRSYTLG